MESAAPVDWLSKGIGWCGITDNLNKCVRWMMGVKKDLAHTTDDELRFIDEIGVSSRCDFSIQQLLRGYIAAAKRRTDWGGVSPGAVIAHAERRLAQLGG